MSIAASVLDALHAEAAVHPGATVTRAGIRIGELSGVEPESLRFCLTAVAPEIAFEFEIAPWTRRCRACGRTFAVGDALSACPHCASSETERGGGDEIELTFLELEQP